MTTSQRQADNNLIDDLQTELRRLESQRARAITQRDRLFTTVESGDDTGHHVVVAMDRVKQLEDRITQIGRLLMQERERAN